MMIMKIFFLAAFFALSSGVMAGGLVSKSLSNSANEIRGLGVADSKFIISGATISGNGAVEKLAMNSGVGPQGKDTVFARSDYCSTGCSTGCSNGCSTGCSYGCSYGCSSGCR